MFLRSRLLKVEAEKRRAVVVLQLRIRNMFSSFHLPESPRFFVVLFSLGKELHLKVVSICKAISNQYYSVQLLHSIPCSPFLHFIISTCIDFPDVEHII